MVNCRSGNDCDNDDNITWSINAEAAKESDEADKTNNGAKYEDNADVNSNTGTKAVLIASTATIRCSKKEQKDPHEFRDNNDDDDNNNNNDDIASSVDIVSTKKKKTMSI